MAIEQKHIDHYRQHGFAIIDNFLSPELLHEAREELKVCLPGWVEYCDDPTTEKPSDRTVPAGARYRFRFPFPGTALNYITLHPDLRQFAAEFVEHDDLYCEQSHLSVKHKDHPGDADQGMHCDYGNHTLAYPPRRPEYWQTAYLMYYTEVTINHAPTAVCSWEYYPEKIRWPPFYSREQRPEIYDNEVKVTVPAGSVLAYSMRTFHRGTPFLKDGGRIGQFITYSPAAWKWLGIVGWSERAPSPEFRKWIEGASPQERTLLGFPEPGHDYWTEETIAGVSARYPKMDMAPYVGERSSDV